MIKWKFKRNGQMKKNYVSIANIDIVKYYVMLEKLCIFYNGDYNINDAFIDRLKELEND